MPPILLRDILISARQESVQMGHYYLGVEHLFIALLQIQGGLTSSILENYGLTPEYVIETLHRKTDKGVIQVLWVGVPYTPRTEIVLNIANDLAAEQGHPEADERDLLCAILDEGDSLPIRVLKSLGIDRDAIAKTARTYKPDKDPQPPDILVEFGKAFDHADKIQREQLFVLRRMFASHNRIRIERRLTGFRGALILVVTPIHADKREDASVVVKIDQVDSILDEVQRYEAHVKHALPLQTARLEDNPTTPESSELAGIKYTLVSNNSGVPQDLRNLVAERGADGVGRLIYQSLYRQFRKTWWQQQRPFRFQVWKEYDWLLPPILTLEFVPEKDVPEHTLSLRIPINRAKLKPKLQQLQFGDLVVVENFVVQRVDRENQLLKLATGYGSEADKRAYKIEVKGLNLSKSAYYRGKTIDRVVGKVWKTRHDLLMEAVRDLEPDFDVRSQSISIGEHRVLNPLLNYDDLLDRHINSSLSKIHGDLHLGNILVGPNNSTWLIDFAHTRDGHTLFDWASLEVSLLGDAVMPVAGDDWIVVRRIASYLAAIHSRTTPPSVNSEIFAAMASIAAIREIARDCLTTKDNWYEYYVALSLCALRAITWPSMSLGGRRLMFLLAGLAMTELNRKIPGSSALETPPIDDIGLTDQLPDVVPMNGAGDLLDEPEPPPPAPPLSRPLAVTRRFDEPEADRSLPPLKDEGLPGETAASPYVQSRSDSDSR
jgi:hypothetical protein